YDIIYLDGAETNADSWTAGTLKGRLHRSGFENEFDLQWFDADQRPAGIENSASLLNQGSTLQLNFPSLETQLRFRRNPNCLLVADPE
ncbi:MAG: hypothetical protein K2O12_04105, partial [Muribaculaceae bacterium]|nr:hypothetical protein [Muribaculaceae bacterium]